MKKRMKEKIKIFQISNLIKKRASRFSFSWYSYCDYTNIRIRIRIASQIKHHILPSSDRLHSIQHIKGIHNSINNIAHTIVRNILFEEKN